VHHGLNLTSTVLLFLAVVVAIARLGGMYSALGAALWASLLLNYYFVLPLHSADIANANDALALAVFVVVALTVASVVDLAARQSRRAARANAEAETLNALSVAVLRGDGALGALLDQLRDAFTATAVSLLQERGPADRRRG
jgi:two-component system sensor histidine kinase KdpD